MLDAWLVGAAWYKTVDWVQWLALGGGLAAVGTFWANRRDASRSLAACIYYVVIVQQQAPPPPGEATITRYKVVNESNGLATSVAISAWGWGRRRVTWRLRRQVGWWTGDRIIANVLHTVTPGGCSEEGEFPGPPMPGPPEERHPLILQFRDGLGREWVRWPHGKLTRMGPSWYQIERAISRRGQRRLEATHLSAPPDNPSGRSDGE